MTDAGLMPPTVVEHSRVHAAVLHDLLFRHTPTVEGIVRVTGLPGTTVSDAMPILKERGPVVDGRSRAIVAAYPLSARPPPHIVRTGRSPPSTNSAADPLAVPAMASPPGTTP